MSVPVDVVVVTYNSAATIGPLLDSLPAAAGTLSYRTAVVDNGSTDTTCEVVRRRGDAELVQAHNDGYASGLNRGVAVLDGAGPILMLNPDCVLEAGCVQRMVEALEETRSGIIVPAILDPDGKVARSLRRRPSLLRSVGLGESRWPLLSEVVTDSAAYERRHRVAWATGAILLVARNCYEDLGGLDESFFMYSEETDFCFRASDLGYATCFEPSARVVHIGAASGKSPELYAMQALNRVRLYRRRQALVPSLLFFLLAVCRELARSAGGDPEARRAFEALTRASRRPFQLPWSGSLMRRSESTGSSAQ